VQTCNGWCEFLHVCGVVVGETFFGDAAAVVNGGSFTYYAHNGWILVAIQFFFYFLFLRHIMPRLTLTQGSKG